jgi:hypothetical protein
MPEAGFKGLFLETLLRKRVETNRGVAERNM